MLKIVDFIHKNKEYIYNVLEHKFILTECLFAWINNYSTT